MEKLTVIIPTLNEEAMIVGALESAEFADEIIVIDSFSIDRTVELAKKHDIILIQHPFEDFTQQRLMAVSRANYNLILFLDADERITELLKEEIINLLGREEHCSAYKIPFTHFFMGRRMRYSTFRNSRKIRLVDKRYCWCDKKLLVHERVIVKEGKVGYLENSIIHYTYRSWDHFINKKQHYAQLQAQQLFIKGLKPNVFHYVIKPSFRFFNQFLLKGGFLDGFPGFASAVADAYGVLCRYIKLNILYRNEIND